MDQGVTASFGDSGFFKLLAEHFATDKCAECGGKDGTCQHNHQYPHASRLAHGVYVGLLRTVSEHGLCPAVRIGKEYKIRTRSAEGQQNVGQRIDLLAFIVP